MGPTTRIVITGQGAVSAIGNDIAAFRANLFGAASGIGPITLFDAAAFGAKIAGEVKDYRPEDHFEPTRLNLLDRFTQFALIAARQAVDDAGLTFTGGIAERSGVFHGTGIGGQGTQDAN